MIPKFQNLFDPQENLDSEDFVKQHITPDRSSALHGCIISALNEYRTKYAELRYKHSACTEANIIHDLIVANIKDEFEHDINTYHVTKSNLFLLGINNGAVVIRFKKMDKNRIVHNGLTRQSFEFNNQLNLFGPSININAGYFLNGLEIEVYVACPENNKRNFWTWPIIAPAVLKSMPVINNEELPRTDRHATAKGKEQESNVAKE